MHLPAHSIEARKQAVDLIDNLSFDKAWTLTTKVYKPKRSSLQNDFYWPAIVREIANHTGHDVGDIHEFLLGESQGWTKYEVLGMTKVRPARRSHDMSMEQFSEYCDWCIMWAARELGLLLEPREAAL